MLKIAEFAAFLNARTATAKNQKLGLFRSMRRPKRTSFGKFFKVIYTARVAAIFLHLFHAAGNRRTAARGASSGVIPAAASSSTCRSM